MPITSAPTGWLKPTSRETGVIIISSGELPAGVIEALQQRIHDWDQVAYLHIPSPQRLQQQWLAAETASADLHTPAPCEASALLGTVPKNCHLLDIEALNTVQLTWLGSVYGHRLHLFGLSAGEDPESQVEAILEATRQLVKHYLSEHFLSPD